jgi:hypothetical protein
LTVVALPENGAPVNPVPDVVWRGIGWRVDWAKDAAAKVSNTVIDHEAWRIEQPPVWMGFGGKFQNTNPGANARNAGGVH